MDLKLNTQHKFLCIFIFSVLFSTNKIFGQHTYQNPILAGWYPDPSITDDGKGNYYMVHSTFAFFPGIPIFHSKDLVNWTQIGNVLDRPEQLDLEGFGVSRAIFAPDISYNKGVFYVTCTVVDGPGNFVVTSKNPAGPWSNLVWLPEVKGIDPGLFFDEDKSYIVYNGDAPNNKPEYDGHRTIRMFEFDQKKLTVNGENRILVNGGVDFSKKPIWAEGPRIYKLNGYYYLMTAEGGTAVNHSEMIYRTKDINSKFIPYKNNPILTQRHLDPDRKHPITSAGHADLVKSPNNEWYGIFLAVRPYAGDFYNTGRETFLAPVKWEEDWPIFDLGGEEIKYNYPLPAGTSINKDLFPFSGNFTFTKNFENETLGFNWLFLRTPHKKWFDLKNGMLIMKTRPETIRGTSNPSFIGHRQQHLKGEASIELTFEANSVNESAGIVAFQNETHAYYLCKTLDNTGSVIQLRKMNEQGFEVLASAKIANCNTLGLKISFDGNKYYFKYALESGNWKDLIKNVDGYYLSTRTAGGFVGTTLAMYTTSEGEESDNIAKIDWFEYSGDDDVYKTE
ncbi:glycoside hydrolase family 43 protein [Gillisia sp. M10.2A]|uniref:Glycoside hydrolase family 43 protein n=1 Tax=Gillisia lutea TaxID=2909668 RepID=A0ABS9EI26_9FLAO|nr:glycoside hydrolase family 43 protein [Gillisia lutea]MCF4101103.1 glycoside hydrolase family 43 protein [Gillisia lutea]